MAERDLGSHRFKSPRIEIVPPIPEMTTDNILPFPPVEFTREDFDLIGSNAIGSAILRIGGRDGGDDGDFL